MRRIMMEKTFRIRRFLCLFFNSKEWVGRSRCGGRCGVHSNRVNLQNTRYLTHRLRVYVPCASSLSRLLTPIKLFELPPSHTATNIMRGSPLVFHGGAHENMRWCVFKARQRHREEISRALRSSFRVEGLPIAWWER